MNKLDKAICINLEVSIWQGRRVLHAEDLRIESTDLPPSEMASLGSKKIIDPEDIKIFNTLKKKAERICSNKSVRFLGGYATSKEAINGIVIELDAIKQEFEQAKVDFLNSYEANIAAWQTQFPKWTEVLSKSVVPKAVVETRICFDYQVFQIQPATDINGEIASDGLNKVSNGLSDQLFREVAKEADSIWERSIRTRNKVSLKILSPIRKIVEKLTTLSFMDSRVSNVIQVTEDALNKLPAVGPLEGNDLLALIGIVELLSSKDKMCSFGSIPSSHVVTTDNEKIDPTNVAPLVIPPVPSVDLPVPLDDIQEPAVFTGFGF